ncbi:MAG: molybdopterin molybdotransferase MoeA [Spirochaetaceae bacterium]|nr:molybdopterin molybdotransferase MoeA [Spirochaetaceae bacterium]
MTLRYIHPDEAIRLVRAAAQTAFPVPRTEIVRLQDALGRRLIKALSSPIDHPPFDKSAMDGFAYARKPGARAYRVVETVAAGEKGQSELDEGDVVRIMTGAPIPAGADAVQRIEWTESAGQDLDGCPLVRFTDEETLSNIIRRGENLEAGEPLLGPRLLLPQDIGILAAGGIAEVEVAAKPRLIVISTGDEICTQGEALGQASIYDSNGPQLRAQAEAFGCNSEYRGIVRDNEEELAEVFGKALDEADIVLVSGGVSMGDFDYVPPIMVKLGVKPVYHSLAMRPGKPSFFGMRGQTSVFGLPGNPVSTFVNFEVLVKPYIRAMTGMENAPEYLPVRLDRALVRTAGDRVEFLPATLHMDGTTLCATPLEYHGSSMITVLASASALLRMEIGQTRAEAGETINARFIRP